MNESELQELFMLATGQGRWELAGPYMHTYPNGLPDDRRLHDGCLELERRGMLARHIDEPEHVCWVAADDHRN